MSIRVEHGDCLDVLPKLAAEGVLFDAVVCDPPYGLEFMGKEWDAPWQTSSKSALFGKPTSDSEQPAIFPTEAA